MAALDKFSVKNNMKIDTEITPKEYIEIIMLYLYSLGVCFGLLGFLSHHLMFGRIRNIKRID
jgi:hypothetical protein